MKSIFSMPLFINPLAYNVIPELYNLSKAETLSLTNNIVIKTVTTGTIEYKLLQAGERVILHLDLYTVDGSCVLGEWYLEGIPYEDVDNIHIHINADNINITVDNDYVLSNAILVANNEVLLTDDGTPLVYDLTIPKAIKDSMVLWYDINRQGATNESMSNNPVLKDLSGNGHDATCYNFAWSRGSGIGGDIAPLIAVNQIVVSRKDFFNKDPDAEIIGFRKFIINGNSNTYLSFDSQDISDNALGSTITLGSFQFIVSGLKEGDRLHVSATYGDYFADTKTILYESNGLYTFPELSVNIPSSVESGRYITLILFIGKNAIKSNSNVTIEILPQYPNALVSDGVDDYAKVTGLPLLTKERGYTVIAKRKWLDLDFNDYFNVFLCKREGSDRSGSFQIERGWNGVVRAYNFGSYTDIEFNNDNSVICQTSNQYNGNSISIGEAVDTDIMYIAFITTGGNTAKLAFYSLLLFDRDLTDEEIEWVKTNLIN